MRTMRHHEGRLMKSGVSITKTRCSRVWGRCRERDACPSGVPKYERCLEYSSEFEIKEQGGPHCVVILDVLDEAANLVTILPARLMLSLVEEHFADAVLIDMENYGVLHHVTKLRSRDPGPSARPGRLARVCAEPITFQTDQLQKTRFPSFADPPRGHVSYQPALQSSPAPRSFRAYRHYLRKPSLMKSEICLGLGFYLGLGEDN